MSRFVMLAVMAACAFMAMSCGTDSNTGTDTLVGTDTNVAVDSHGLDTQVGTDTNVAVDTHVGTDTQMNADANVGEWTPGNYTVQCSDGMCLIPAGPFGMGCDVKVDKLCASHYDDEGPFHQVTLSAYYMDKTEVTVSAYSACVAEEACTPPGTYDLCNRNVAGKEDYPVNCITWDQSKAYCEWAGKRLPTEAEWEKAARGTDSRIYPWGIRTATCDYAVMNDGNGDGCNTNGTMAVCSKSPAGDSPYGLCDMAGNVTEWVSDWYNMDYYDVSPETDPTGPDSGDTRVLRGGLFAYILPATLRVTYRSTNYPYEDGGGAYGVRCAKSL